MITTRLEIALAAPSSSNGTQPHVGLHRGGPDVLLRWLETQLGLAAPEEPAFRRVAELATALEASPGASFAESLARDRWATATELLDRWDELRLAGWDGAPHPDLPPLAADGARRGWCNGGTGGDPQGRPSPPDLGPGEDGATFGSRGDIRSIELDVTALF